jgi:hypothetical protein
VHVGLDKIAQIVVCGVQYCLDVFHDPDDLRSDAACDCSVFLGSLSLALKQTETHTLSTLDRTDLQGQAHFQFL